MRYVYGCPKDKTHPTVEVRHGMTEAVRLYCDACGAEMTRRPQLFRWGHAPFDVLLEGLEEKHRKDRYRRSLSK